MNLGKTILDELENKCFNDLEKARFIYIELAKYLSFSTTYFNTDTKNHNNMYNKKVNVFNLKSTNIICTMWAQLYSQLLNLVNIENEIIDFGNHQYVEFYISGRKYVADAIYDSYNDLTRIKNNDDTEYFGYAYWQSKETHMNTVDMISTKEELEAIDKKINYNNDKKRRLIEFKQFLNDIRYGKVDIRKMYDKEVITGKSDILLKLEYLFSRIGIINDYYYESRSFVYELEKILLTSEEIVHVSTVELKRTNIDKTVNIIQCITVEDNGQFIHYLLAPNLPIQKVTPEQIISLAVRGYGIHYDSIPGIIFPNKFVPGKRKINFKYALYKAFFPKNMIDEYAEQPRKMN